MKNKYRLEYKEGCFNYSCPFKTKRKALNVACNIWLSQMSGHFRVDDMKLIKVKNGKLISLEKVFKLL